MRNMRTRILEAAYELFYRRGFVRVGMDEVAAAAGVTKRTLYYHFESKDALLAAALEFQHDLTMSRMRRWSGRVRGSLDQFVERLFGELAAWAGQPRWEGSGFTRLTMELADLPGHPARAIAKRHKAAIEGWLTEELAAREVANAPDRARHIMLLLEGCLSMILIAGDRTYAARAAEAARQLLAGAASAPISLRTPRARGARRSRSRRARC